MRPPHLAWAHLPYRRVDIGNLAKTNAGRGGGRGWRGALQMPARLARVFCIAFSICTLHAFIALRFRRKTLDRSLGPRANRGIVNVLTAAACAASTPRSALLSDRTLEREAIISEMQVECLTVVWVRAAGDCVIIIAETILSLISPKTASASCRRMTAASCF